MIKEFILLNIVLPGIDKLLGTKISYWRKYIEKINTFSAQEVTKWQNQHLQKFIQHAFRNTIYYRELFSRLSLQPEDIKTIADLKKIPSIDKDEIQKNREKIIPKNLNSIPHKKGRTGGTTGMPLHYLYDENTWGYITAIKIISWKSKGYRYGDKYVVLGSSSLFPTNKKSWKHIFYFALRNGIPLNGMNISDDIARKYVQIIKKKKVKFIFGYAASIYLLTKYIDKNNVDMSGIKGVFTTSEVLTDTYRELMEKTYGCVVMDCYGARDAGITAYEIIRGQYHVSYNSIAEVENRANDGSGPLLVTNLLNYSFPLIRYRLGDDAILQENPTQYNGQVISKIIGRTSDVMYFDNGHCLTATGFSIMIRDFNVVAFKMLKTKDQRLVIEIQPKTEYSDTEHQLLWDTIKKYIGDDIELEITKVDHFEPLKNGKRQYFINE